MPLSPYTGAVAGRTFTMGGFQAANTPYATQIFDYARDNLTNIILDFPNFATETDTGGTLAVNWAHIEYPLGTYTRVKFGGSNSGSCGSGTKILSSDSTTITVPSGALFRIRWSWQNSVRLPYADASLRYLAGGDIVKQSATDFSMGAGGSFTDDGLLLGFWPCGIRGTTTKRTLGVIGDSRQRAGCGQSNVLGEQGEIARSLGQQFGHTNVAVDGDTATSFNGFHTNRLATLVLAAPTDIVYAYGINDLGGGVSAATLNGLDASIAALFPSQSFWYCSMPPHTASSDNWATQGNQSPAAAPYVDASRISVNNTRRAKSLFLEIADALENARDGGNWKTDGTAQKYVKDGLHESQFGTDAIGTLPAFTPVTPPPLTGNAKYQMQARSSSNQQLYTWLADSPDWTGSAYSGPGTPLDIVKYATKRAIS